VSRVTDPPMSARGLSAIRALPDGGMRQHSAVEWPTWNGVEHFIRTLDHLGYVKPSSSKPSYAVLDVLDADGDIIADYDVPTAAAFRYIKRKLQLRVEHPPTD
jgi:hypothetical protein